MKILKFWSEFQVIKKLIAGKCSSPGIQSVRDENDGGKEIEVTHRKKTEDNEAFYSMIYYLLNWPFPVPTSCHSYLTGTSQRTFAWQPKGTFKYVELTL